MLAFSSVASHLEQKLVRGTCSSKGGCHLRPLPNQPMLSLTRLAAEGLEDVEEAITPNWLRKVEDTVQILAPVGTVGGCAVLVYAAAKVIQFGSQRLCHVPTKFRRRAVRVQEEDEAQEIPLNPMPVQQVVAARPLALMAPSSSLVSARGDTFSFHA